MQADDRLVLDWLIDLCRSYRDRVRSGLDLVFEAEREAAVLAGGGYEEADASAPRAAEAFLALWERDQPAVQALAANVVRWVHYGIRPARWTEAPDAEVVPDLAASLRARDGVETCEEATARTERERVDRLAQARARAEERRRTRPHEAARERAYGQAALDRACAEILGAVEGDRHRSLNRVAWGIGRLVGGEVLLEAEAHEALVAAGVDLGLPARDVERIVRRALADGAAKAPRGMLEDSTAEQRSR